MVPPIYLPLSYLRLQPLALPRCRLRLRPILASSSFSFHDDYTFKPRKVLPRDVRIKIGRYKGRMLGTLPSSYLKWLSNPNDPDTDFSLTYWTELAKLVLQDPVYQDRIEWEPAWKLFTGEAKVYDSESFDWRKAYREIGDKYGWDMDDKEGWSKVKREFIGTSFSGRIPRKKDKKGKLSASESVKSEAIEKKKKKGVSLVGGRRGERIERMRLKREKEPGRIEVEGAVNKSEDLDSLDDQNGVKNDKKSELLVGQSRGERIERMRLRREKETQMVKSSEVVEEEILEEKQVEVSRIRIQKERVRRPKKVLRRRRRELGVGRNDEIISFAERDENSGNVEVFNPFPGRDALLEKIRSRQD